MPFSEGPMEVILDQRKGSLIFKSKVYEFRTDLIKPDEDYRLMFELYFEDVELECKIIQQY